MVVYGRDGMDEVSLGASTLVGELKDGQITEYEIHPEDFGMPMVSNRALRVETPEESQAVLRAVLNNEAGAARDIVILNAGAALYVANVSDSIKEGIALAREAIASGAAKKKMEQFVAFTQKSGGAA
jgi:anthranilate phosphoribosyltransferase